MALPPPSENQPYFHVSPIEAGTFLLRLEIILEGSTDKVIIPSLAFLLRSSASNKTLMFDLGVRSDLTSYPRDVQQRIAQKSEPVRVPLDAAQALAGGGLDPATVDYVIYSHLHWDHVGDHSPFTNATFLLGAESQQLLAPGFHDENCITVGADCLPSARTQFISGDWAPVGPFPRALDFFGDGSAYLVDAVGHCPGHTNLLARTSPDGGWIYLAGDSAHDWALVRGEGSIALRRDADGRVTGALIHTDRRAAEEHIARIAKLAGVPRVRVMLAHDREWWEKNKGGPAFWPGQIESF